MASAADRSVLIEGDAFFGFLANGRIEPWLSGSHDQNIVVTQAAAAAAGHFATNGYDAVFDGVVGPWFLPTFAAATGLDHLDYVILLPSVERCVVQVGHRVDHGFKDEGATRKMHEEFADAEVAERYVLREPLGSVEDIVAKIRAARDAGELTYPG